MALSLIGKAQEASLASYLQVQDKLQAAQATMIKMQGVISTDTEAEKCLSGMLEKFHRRLSGLVSAAPVTPGDRRARELHVAPRVNEMLEKYKDEVCCWSVPQCIDVCWQPCLMQQLVSWA